LIAGLMLWSGAYDDIAACSMAKKALMSRMTHPTFAEADVTCSVRWQATGTPNTYTSEISGEFMAPNAFYFVVNNDYRVGLTRVGHDIKVDYVHYDDYRGGRNLYAGPPVYKGRLAFQILRLFGLL
jgi:hypothetical protein